MSDISIFGAGAFGTALAISLARDGNSVHLIARSKNHSDNMRTSRQNAARLAGVTLPDNLRITSDGTDPALICLLAVPTQALGGFLREIKSELVGRTVVACCKGIDLKTGLGPTGTILAECPTSEAAILSGPGFAADIAAGLPAALTIAARTDGVAEFLQTSLATQSLRLYRSTDIVGVELGGALKNIVAIAAGVTIGAGLGDSARTALMTRGFEELRRYATAQGAKPATLSGLSGLGDLILTCTSQKSRNFTYGVALGQGKTPDTDVTVEGIATAHAVAKFAESDNIEMPVTTTIAALISGDITTQQAVDSLLSRPLKKE